MLILILALAVPICICEGWPLYRERRRKELVIFGTVILATLAITLVGALRLPTPLVVLGRWLHPLGEALFRHY